MILTHTLNNLTEEEISILFFIGDKLFSPLGIKFKINYIKMFRIHVLIPIIDTLRSQALEEKHNIFDSLKEKISNQI
jgi:hypothetical protein